MSAAQTISAGNTITCESCGHVQPVRRQNPRGSGASYVREWTRLPRQQMKILACWLSHDDEWGPITKVDLRRALGFCHIPLTENSSSARVCELLGLGLIRLAGVERRETPHRTTAAPRYRVAKEAAARVLNQDGGLIPG